MRFIARIPISTITRLRYAWSDYLKRFWLIHIHHTCNQAQASVYYNRGLSNSSLSEEEKALAFHDLALTDLYSLRVVQSARLNQDYHQVTLRLGGSSNSGLYNTDVAYYLINQMMQHATDITSFSLSPFISRASAIPQEFLSHAVLDWSILYLPSKSSLALQIK